MAAPYSVFATELYGDLEMGVGSLKVIEMPPFDSLGKVSYTTSIATMAVSFLDKLPYW